jgi:periplasmic protein TonB
LLARKSAAETNSQRIGLVAALALHVAVLAALLSYAPVRHAMLDAAPIVVSYILPEVVEKPPEPPKPMPVRAQPKSAPRPVDPAPPLAITPDAPAAVETPVPEVVTPLPPIQEAPPPQVAPLAPATPPNFSAAYLDNPPPAYPALSRRNGEQGRVLLRVFVTPGGTADKVELHTSSKWARLDQVAQETVKRWRFVPARQGDQAVAAWVLVPITFTLEN